MKIEKEIEIAANIEKVWAAIGDYRNFGKWFQVNLDQPFETGGVSTGSFDIKGFEHIKWHANVVEVSPPNYLSLNWHPYAIDPNTDYSNETPTLCEFILTQIANGTLVRIIESGFENLPRSRQDEAFRMNDQGWSIQIARIHDFVMEL